MDSGQNSATLLEAALKRDRIFTLAGLTVAVVFSWLYLVPMALDMYGSMDGPARWMMAGTWDARYFSLMFLMWSVMMAGMMLPSAAPTLLLYGSVLRKNEASSPTISRIYAFAAGYVLAWAGFSAVATLLQWLLSRAALLSPMMSSARPAFGAAILIAAGVYQWTNLKQACLILCRSPVQFIADHWQSGTAGALRMGLRHGLYCIGCCWMLMLLLFFGGVMNLLWIAALTVAVLIEKQMPYGEWVGRISGLLLVAAGIGVFLNP